VQMLRRGMHVWLDETRGQAPFPATARPPIAHAQTAADVQKISSHALREEGRRLGQCPLLDATPRRAHWRNFAEDQ